MIKAMIGKLTGRFDGITPDGSAIIDTGGVGYAVRLSASNLRELQAKQNADISLFIHTAVREDAIDLYGFPTLEELSFFKNLISVSSIGPKTALGILNVADVSTLKRGIAQGDASMLTKVFGIGKKSAERIVVELRDKLVTEVSARGESVGGGGDDIDVIEALIALGYSAAESRAALKKIPGEISGTRERLSAALKNLGTHA
ncbi:Holliday junction branch migration protein RuvA [Acetobacteraceae bacterium]|nr:Holliday junction branch migration protein RuvA [Candidatus Parcubacteria bacterium]